MKERHTLQHTPNSQEALHILRRERVRASFHRLSTSSSQGLGQELLVGLLVLGDPLHVRIDGVLASGGHEVGVGVVLQTLFVEGCLQMLEGQSIVENVRWEICL